MRQIFTHFHRGKSRFFSLVFQDQRLGIRSDSKVRIIIQNVDLHVTAASHIRCTTMSEHESSAGEKVAQANQSQSVTCTAEKHKYQGVLRLWQPKKLPSSAHGRATFSHTTQGEGKCWMNSRELFSGKTYTVFSHFLSPTQTVANKNFNFEFLRNLSQ